MQHSFPSLSQIFVPTYAGSEMKMLKVFDMGDYENLPLTKWKIRQPDPDDSRRENPMLTGDDGGSSVWRIMALNKN
jgi:5-formyltetrahydrofolate cyclo-ligase